MLFDLRSRNRRTAVRIIYVLLAVVMAAGLIGFGVGTGTSGGGLLNSFDGSGSGSSSSNSAAVKQVNTALAQTQANPNSAAAWLALMQARYVQAQSSTKYYSAADDDSSETNGTYTPAGREILNQGIAAWQKYLKVTNDKPSLNGTELAHLMYTGVEDWAGLTQVYQYWVRSTPNAPGPFVCMTLAAYAASNKTVGDLAAVRAKQLTAKSGRAALSTAFAASRKTPNTAKEYYVQVYLC